MRIFPSDASPAESLGPASSATPADTAHASSSSGSASAPRSTKSSMSGMSSEDASEAAFSSCSGSFFSSPPPSRTAIAPKPSATSSMSAISSSPPSFPAPPAPPPPVSTHPSSSPSRCLSAPANASIAAARSRHGTLRVTRNCFSLGRYGFALAGSPPCHDHVGHCATRKSPARTNSSGVTTPFSRNALLVRVVITLSAADLYAVCTWCFRLSTADMTPEGGGRGGREGRAERRGWGRSAWRESARPPRCGE